MPDDSERPSNRSDLVPPRVSQRRIAPSDVGKAALLLAALATAAWFGGGSTGRVSFVDRSTHGREASPAGMLVAAAGGDRLTIREAELAHDDDALVGMLLGPSPAVMGDAGQRHRAIDSACRALQVGDARAARTALECYDAVGTPLRAIVLYVDGDDRDVAGHLLLEAVAETYTEPAPFGVLKGAVVWFAGRALIPRGEYDAAREVWSLFERTDGGSDTFTRMAERVLKAGLLQ